MKIKKLNSSLLNESLTTSGVDFAYYANELAKTDNKLSAENVAIDFKNQLDPTNLMAKIRDIIVNRFSQNIDKNDPFIKWLSKTNDYNIKNLGPVSATTLINLLDNNKISFDNQYIIDRDYFLFSESDKELSYKLNIVAMLLDPKVADKYKNPAGETPTLNMILDDESGMFLNAKEMREKLEDFTSESNNDGEDDESDNIPFLTWLHTQKKVQKGKEYDYLIQAIRTSFNYNRILKQFIIADLDVLNKDFPSKFKELLKTPINLNKNDGEILKIITDKLSSSDYDVVKGKAATVKTALFINLPATFKLEDIEPNLKDIIIKLLGGRVNKDQEYKIDKLINYFKKSYLYSIVNTRLTDLKEFTLDFLKNKIK